MSRPSSRASWAIWRNSRKFSLSTFTFSVHDTGLPSSRRHTGREGSSGLTVTDWDMEANQKPSAPVAPDQARRRRLLLSLTTAAALVAVAYGAYWGLYARHFESTDDAYVAGNLIQLTPQVAGTVVSINADDTDRVEAGQAVIKLDPADTKVAMAFIQT